MKVQFEVLKENRLSDIIGPYDLVHVSYDILYGVKNGQPESLAYYNVDGQWVTNDNQRWSGFIIF